MARYGYNAGGAPRVSPQQQAKLHAAMRAERARDALLSQATDLLKPYALGEKEGPVPAEVVAEVERLQAEARAIEIPSIM